ncbi:hypothetical protein STANM337S_00515 [Streptomyces tanashiensis]
MSTLVDALPAAPAVSAASYGDSMTEIAYVRGDATAPQAKGVKIVAHVCNDLGGWGKGFVLALSRRWPEPEAAFRRWHRERAGNDFGLGAAQFVQVEPYVWVANLVGQRGIPVTVYDFGA